ncbi:hypothetical protein SLEP1_g42833 [Rubroshorea leprosula]|uniref:Uncharacterized protein n=1 Tax=Rubroshorea leprosula TaxID=152421 RepID=A0AAV5LB40_9ROSI|nr:hypothetical protein SLEP1_g42833 [Rubroshorea leprosula]
MALPLIEDSMGNLVASFAAQTETGDISLPILVNELRRKKEEFCQKLAEIREDNPASGLFRCTKDARDLYNKRNEINIYMSSSWCKFPLYEANFGWGKPSWVVPVPLHLVKNLIILMDTKDGEGIEAWVILSEEEMAYVL